MTKHFTKVGKKPIRPKMTVEKYNKKMCNGEFNSPKKGKQTSYRRRFQDELTHKLETVGKIKALNELTKKICEDYGVNYTLEAIAHIILAKEIRLIKIWTPFSECQLRKLGKGKSNYIAKVGSKSLKYEDVISNLNDKNDKTIIDDIQKFFAWELPEDFKINLGKSESLNSEINSNLKKFGSKTTNENAAAMCGIFVAEIVRTAGKIVRAHFVKEWPKSASELCKAFVQARPGGNAEIRNFIVNPESVDPDVVEAVKCNVARFSPDKRKKYK